MSRALVVEADGGSRGNPGPAGYGAVVVDAATGEVLAEVAEAIGRATNNVAEYRGLLAGLRAAIAIDAACTVEVRMDSKLVVEQMSGRWQIKHDDMKALAAQARGVLPASRVRYSWIPRAQNVRADRLANQAMDAAAAGRAWAPASAPVGAARVSAAPQPSSRPDSARAPRGADVGDPTVLLLVRHGRTELTEQRRFSGAGGALDPHLSDAGRDDAARAARALASLGGEAPALPDVGPPSAVVCSPIARTRETAHIVAGALGLAVEVADDWAEIAYGEWDGLTYAEVSDGWPDRLRAWQGSTSEAPPGGESLDDHAARIRSAREKLVADHPGEVVVVVTHVTPVRCVVAHALDAGPAALWRTRISPASVTAVRYWSDGGIEVVAVNTCLT